MLLQVFTCGSLMLVYGMLNGVIKISGEYAQSVMSTVLIMAIGVLIMVHAIKYFYKHNMVRFICVDGCVSSLVFVFFSSSPSSSHFSMASALRLTYARVVLSGFMGNRELRLWRHFG